MSEPRRVAHVIRSDGFAGVERHVAVLARAQAATGDTVTVIGGNRERMPDALQGTPVLFLPGETVMKAVQALSRVAADAHLIHAHMTAAELAASIVTMRRAHRVPVVATRHFAAARGQSRLGQLAAGFVKRRISVQLAVSQFVADQVEGATTVVYPGVEAVEAPETRRDQTVLVVQRLEPEKRTDIAVAAFARSGLAQHGWRLQIAGDGSLREELARQASALNVAADVDFLGTRSDISALMQRASILLAPCPIEGLGLVVLEAMAGRLPVVASQAGGHLETLPTQAHRHCFRPNQADEASAALKRLATDPELRRRLADAGLQRQREYFTPEVQAATTAAVYDQVIAAQEAIRP